MNELDVSAFTGPAVPNVRGDGEENTEDSQTETETTGTDEDELEDDSDGGQDKEDKKRPFHEHPRWKEREKDWEGRMEKMKQELSEASAKEIATLRAQISERKEETAELTEADIPDWFNGDLETYKKFESYQTSKMQKLVTAAAKAAEDNAVNRIKGESERETKAIQDATNWLESEVARLQDSADLNPSGKPINRAELFAIAQRDDLIDSKGRWNYQAAMRIYAREHKDEVKDDENKEEKTLKRNISALTVKSDSKSSGSRKTIASADSFKGKGWDNLDD